MCAIRLASGSDNLTLKIHGRTKADAQDHWGANWLHCTATACVGGFHATVEWQLRNEDLVRFMEALRNVEHSRGEALLATGDGWLDVRVIRDNEDQVEARCQLVENENSLEFRLPLEKAILTALIHEVREVIEQYPVLG